VEGGIAVAVEVVGLVADREPVTAAVRAVVAAVEEEDLPRRLRDQEGQ